MLKKALIVLVVISVSVLLLWWYTQCQEQMETEVAIIRLATSASTVDSGLMDAIIPLFEADGRYKVEVFGVGSGKALDMGKAGKADVLLVHSREDEDPFVLAGYGTNRRDVMYNEFVIVGPQDNQLFPEVYIDVVAALKLIHRSGAPFVSRGDRSGAHMREMSLWEASGIEPAGTWHTETKTGTLKTMRVASDQDAYTLADLSSYLFNKAELDLTIVCQGDNRLFNPYAVIVINPIKVPGVNYQGAMEFLEFMTSGRGQAAIENHGVDQFKISLFKPLVRSSE